MPGSIGFRAFVYATLVLLQLAIDVDDILNQQDEHHDAFVGQSQSDGAQNGKGDATQEIGEQAGPDHIAHILESVVFDGSCDIADELEDVADGAGQQTNNDAGNGEEGEDDLQDTFKVEGLEIEIVVNGLGELLGEGAVTLGGQDLDGKEHGKYDGC